MESSGKTQRLIGFGLVFLLVALTAWAAWAQLHCPQARALADKTDKTLYLAVLTQPAMTASYNPARRKITLTTVKRRKTPKDPLENAKDLFAAAGIETEGVTHYFIPQTLQRDAYWDETKLLLTNWRYNPYLVVRTLWAYIKAVYDKRTNLSLPEFILLTADFTRLELTDFTVRTAGDEKKKPSRRAAAPDGPAPIVEDKAPLAVADGPLRVEILNGSGKKGAALELTQYLRNKYEKGLLYVDVLQYDNYPGGRLPQTQIIDYSGRLVQVKQLSTAIGVNNEIISENAPQVIVDTRIIIGEDFKQPL